MTQASKNVLSRLNEIGAAINQLVSDEQANVADILGLIVDSAVAVVPGSSSVIYTYHQESGSFDADSRVAAEGASQSVLDDFPRPDGLGQLAVREGRRVLSYQEEIDIHPAKVRAGAKIMICSPLRAHHRTLGVLYLYLHQARQPAEIELLMLDNFVNQAAMALYVWQQRMQGREREIRKARELRRLSRAGMLISSRSNLQDTLQAILSMAVEVLGAQYGIFRLVDRQNHTLVTQAFIGEGLRQPALEPLPIDATSIMGLAALGTETIRIGDLRDAPYCHVYYPLDPRTEMRSEIAVPLIGVNGGLEGVLNFESPQIEAFSHEDQYLLEVFATQAVIAIQEARLLDALQHTSGLLLSRPVEEVLDHIVLQACDLLNAGGGQLWLVQGNQLVLRAASGEELPAEPLDIEDSLPGRVIRTAAPVTSRDLGEDPAFQGQASAGKAAWGSALMVPITDRSDRMPLGVLCIYSPATERRDFEEAEWEKKVLSLLGHYAAQSVQNLARLEELQAIQEQRAVAETFAAVGDIAANLLHRLNNKIGTIPVRVEGILDKCRPLIQEDAYLGDNLLEIERSATQAMEIVRDNLFHLHPITLVPVNLENSVREAIARSEIPPGIAIRWAGLHEIPLVLADHQRLSLVFTNLLDNSVAAMQGEGQIDFQAVEQDGWVEIKYADSGPGIPQDLLARIFEFTYSTHARQNPGKLGFGLWWVKTWLTRFGGSVTVKSNGQGGTCFTLRLPQAEIHEEF